MHGWLAKRIRLIVFTVTALLVVIAGVLSFRVEANYDLTAYLPDDSMTAEGVKRLRETFGDNAVIDVMVSDVDDVEAGIALKALITSVEGVLAVEWLDDVVDVTDMEAADPMVVAGYYQQGHARFIVMLAHGPYDVKAATVMDELREILSDHPLAMRGEAVENAEERRIAEGAVVMMMAIVLPVSIIILVVASKSWLEPALVLIVLGVAVVLNMGTNVFLPEISFITLTLAAALQLAISLDYSLFMIHRYYEHRDEGEAVHVAIKHAWIRAFPAILASALTTIAGFMALLFMRYGIGMDIGVVLAKGIALSFVSVMVLMPLLIAATHTRLEAWRHRAFVFHLGGLGKAIVKARYALVVLLVLLAGVGFFFQQRAPFYYGTSRGDTATTDAALEARDIRAVFGVRQPVVVLLETIDNDREIALISDIMQIENVMYVDALVTRVDLETVPKAALPPELVMQYEQGGMARLMVLTSVVEEDEAMFNVHDAIDAAVASHYDTYYLLGRIPGTAEIRDTVLADTPIVMLASVGAIALVLLLVFRNGLVPVLMLLVIQAAIWVNVGVLGVFETRVVYIGYLVVLALQLGATIDYAVLLMSRYREMRRAREPKEAVREALRRSSVPIMISGFVLASAGFASAATSGLSVIADIGLLIGRGALLSLVFVLVFLPALCHLFDRGVKPR